MVLGSLGISRGADLFDGFLDGDTNILRLGLKTGGYNGYNICTSNDLR